MSTKALGGPILRTHCKVCWQKKSSYFSTCDASLLSFLSSGLFVAARLYGIALIHIEGAFEESTSAQFFHAICSSPYLHLSFNSPFFSLSEKRPLLSTIQFLFLSPSYTYRFWCKPSTPFLTPLCSKCFFFSFSCQYFTFLFCWLFCFVCIPQSFVFFQPLNH